MRVSKLCYLAGPITGLTFEEADDWRDIAASRLAEHGIIALSPLRGKDYLRGIGRLLDQYHELNVLSSQKGIVTRDRWDCMRADVVLVNFAGTNHISIGTVMECAWADAARVPIVMVLPRDNIHNHAMLREVAGFLVETLDEAIATVIALLDERS